MQDFTYTGCPTKHDSWYKQFRVFSSTNFFNTKDNNKNIIQESYYSKINFKVKYTRGKDFFKRNKPQTAFGI